MGENIGHISVEEAKALAEKFGLSHIVIYTHKKSAEESSITTYGKTTEQCAQAAGFGNNMKSLLDWPKSLHDQPPRVKALEDRIAELEDELRIARSK